MLECWSWQSALSLRWKSGAISLQLGGLERRQGCSSKTCAFKKGKEFFSHVSQRLYFLLVQLLVLYGWDMRTQVFCLIFAALKYKQYFNTNELRMGRAAFENWLAEINRSCKKTCWDCAAPELFCKDNTYYNKIWGSPGSDCPFFLFFVFLPLPYCLYRNLCSGVLFKGWGSKC